MKADKVECKICDERVEKDDKGVNCDMCEWWYHVSCLRMNEATYKFYSGSVKSASK